MLGPPPPPPMPGFNTIRRLLKEKKTFEIDAKISKRLMWKKVGFHNQLSLLQIF